MGGACSGLIGSTCRALPARVRTPSTVPSSARAQFAACAIDFTRPLKVKRPATLVNLDRWYKSCAAAQPISPEAAAFLICRCKPIGYLSLKR